jgi:putative glutamine amidotransferase
MQKPIIGIIAQRHIGENDRIFQNMTRFTSSFPNMIYLAGGIPVGVLFVNNIFNKEIMDICDGFVLQGGNTIESSQILAVRYAILNHKPILGVCLGIQTMATYEWLVQNGILEDEQIIKEYKEDDLSQVLEMRNGHNNLDPFYLSEIDKSKHKVYFGNSCRLRDIYNKDMINVPSIHNYIIKDSVFTNSKVFNVVGRSNDGIIEAIEGKGSDFAIGVQFHPELEEANLPLFEETIKEARLVRKR